MRKVMFAVVLMALSILVSHSPMSYAKAPKAKRTIPNTSIPYVATRSDTVRDMLLLAGADKDDVVFDLGSGDGRIVISAVRDFDAHRAVGVEIDPNLIDQSRVNAQKAGVSDKVKFIQSDLFNTDFSKASVVCLYLGHKPNIRLRPKLVSTLKPGSRIVTHQFAMGEWTPAKELTVNKVFLGMYGEALGPFDNFSQVPDYTGNESHHGTTDKVFMWVVPAPIAGVWRGKLKTQRGEQEMKLTLQQTLSKTYGTFELSGQTDLSGGVGVDLWGSHVRFWCNPKDKPYGKGQLIFDGTVHEDTLKGKIAVFGDDQIQEYDFQAKRDKADLTGTWQWPSATKSHQLKFRIEKENGKLTATYLDRDQIIPVTDFYNFGGGFYFTLLIRSESTREIAENAGWLIGEGTLDDGTMNGRVMFYPYSSTQKNTTPVINEWNSKTNTER